MKIRQFGDHHFMKWLCDIKDKELLVHYTQVKAEYRTSAHIVTVTISEIFAFFESLKDEKCPQIQLHVIVFEWYLHPIK